MNADEPDSRRVLFTAPARQDLLCLKMRGFDRSCWERLRANLERLAGCPFPENEPNVERLRMCGELGGSWLRWKHDCIPVKPGIRVVFQVTADTLTVWACLPRTDSTYAIVEKRLRDWLKGVLG